MSDLAERILEQMSALGEYNQPAMYQRIRMMCEDEIKADCKHHRFNDRVSRVQLIEKDLVKRSKGQPDQARLAYVFPKGEFQIVTDAHWMLRFKKLDGFTSGFIAKKPEKEDDQKRYVHLYDGFDTVLKMYRKDQIKEFVTLDRHDLLAYEKIHKRGEKFPGYPVNTLHGKSWYNRDYVKFVLKFLGVDEVQAGLSEARKGLRTLIICTDDDTTAIITPIRVEGETEE